MLISFKQKKEIPTTENANFSTWLLVLMGNAPSPNLESLGTVLRGIYMNERNNRVWCQKQSNPPNRVRLSMQFLEEWRAHNGRCSPVLAQGSVVASGSSRLRQVRRQPPLHVGCNKFVSNHPYM